MRLIDARAAGVHQAPRAAGLRARVLVGAEPTVRARCGLAEIDVAPGRSLPAHAHGDAETVIYVVRGRGRVVGEGSAVEVRGGDAIQVPVGERVAVTNLGADTLRLVAVFAPAGFERTLGEWPRATDAGPGDESPSALLDLTGLPRPQRHRTVVAALEALDAGTPLVVVSDHEPRALRRQLERRYGPRLGWDPRENSCDRVAVAIWLEESEEPPEPTSSRRYALLTPAA